MNIFNLFGSVPAPKLKRNKFNLSHDVKLTTEFGNLTPMLILESNPGDTLKFSTETFCRLSPLVSPVMDRISIFNYYHKIPYRLIMGDENYNKFFVEGELGYLPKISFTAAEANRYLLPGTLLDYLGYPTLHYDSQGQIQQATFTGTMELSALRLLAYAMVYNEYFRDENLIEEIEIPQYTGAMSATEFEQKGLLSLRRKAYKKDYFTSALPWTQKGPQALMPLQADVDIFNKYLEEGGNMPQTEIYGAGGYQTTGNQYIGNNNSSPSGAREVGSGHPVAIDNSNLLSGKLGQVSATINDLRIMTATQRYLEAKARGGSRTAEWLLSIYGVRPSDLRLHRPQFLGSTKTPIVMSAVDQTSATSDVSPQAHQAGKGLGLSSGSKIKTFCDEHCIVLGLTAVVPQNTYFQGCSRFLTKFDPYDFFIPQFQGLGEQEVKKSELYFNFNSLSTNDQTFGYQSRYSEYKFEPSRVHGDFKGTLSFYHLGRVFGNSPALNQSFIEINPSHGDLNRIFAYMPDEAQSVNFDHFWLEFYHHASRKSPMKLFGVPSIV